MGYVRPFRRQKAYKHFNSRQVDKTLLKSYVFEFLDWYHDNLGKGEIRNSAEWMTAFRTGGHRALRYSIQRGVRNYIAARGYFPNFQKATDFTHMTLMNSMVLSLPVKNPADKLLVGAQIPDEISHKVSVSKIHRVFKTGAEVDLEGLPPGSYFIKSNHGSAQFRHLDLREGTSHIDIAELRQTAQDWLDNDYGNLTSQWWYKLIDRRVFIEEDLRDNFDHPLEDLRFHCINGKVAILQLDVGHNTDARHNPIYDRNLNYMPGNFLRLNKEEVPLHPMTEIARDYAEVLARDHQYVRVDFYAKEDHLFLGELTFLPNAGKRLVQSPELNEYLCECWDPMPQVVDIAPLK